MYLHLQNLLKPAELTEIINILNNATFADGKQTATGAAQQVKNNLQLPREDVTSRHIGSLLEAALQANFLFREALLPRAVLPFLISRYETGMQYGWHVDSPLMYAHPVQLRADLSMTVFLNGPDEYEGGELEIISDAGAQLFKLNAGDAVIYPTTVLHRVRELTQGKRLVAVTWIQSMVKSTEQRTLLFQLRTLQDLLQNRQLGSEEHLLSQQLHSNLLRMWGEL